MSDYGRDGHGTADEDRLPWLEPVEEEPIDEGVSAARLIAGLVVALIALGLVVGGVYWLKQRTAGGDQVASTAGDTIPAPAGPYKVKPGEPGGMQVKGQGDSSYAASEGAEVNGQIDLAATPETPMARPTPAPAPAATPPAAALPHAPLAAPKPVETAKPAPAPAPAPVAATGGGLVQLGAFDSQAQANAAWKSLSGRFSVLSGLAQTVTPVEVKGRTFYRLRAAAGAKAGQVCAKLKVAGEACQVIG